MPSRPRASSTTSGSSTSKRRKASSEQDGRKPAAKDSSGAGDRSGQTVTTVRLPLITVAITRSGSHPAASAERAVEWARVSADAPPEHGRAQQVAFFAGAAALGALEVIEWPVALLVAAGTYLAGRSRGWPAPLSHGDDHDAATVSDTAKG